ncbi:RRP12-like protein isoform X3 [Aquarana catesbeiana]|uniref:RRP12-like protein isoform X3 n=1 Tax=Aquarana catesbeiana TaxID=8400 RepID=UPI003CC97112
MGGGFLDKAGVKLIDPDSAESVSIEEILADTEEEDEKKRKQQKKRTRQMSRAWLKEGEGDEPLNFLDANAAQRVLATKQSHDFRVTSDGRLIMEDGEAGEEENSQGVDEEMADLMKEVGLRTLAAQEYTDPFTESQTLERHTNQRKKAKMRGQFKGLVKAAQRGAQTGRKKRKERRV